MNVVLSQLRFWARRPFVRTAELFPPFSECPISMGLTICHTGQIVQSTFLDGVLIVRYINKMATNGGGEMVDGVTLRRLQAILVPG